MLMLFSRLPITAKEKPFSPEYLHVQIANLLINHNKIKEQLQLSLKIERKQTPVKTLLRKCPCCKTGTLITIEVFGKRGPPPQYLLESPSLPVN
jgi:hypothetical protein